MEWLRKNPSGLCSTDIINGAIGPDPSIHNAPGLPNIFLDILNDTERSLCQWTSSYAEQNFKKILVFGTGRRTASGNITLCEITTSYVDSKIDCKRPSDGGDLSCAAKAVRHTKDRPLAGNMTAFHMGLTWEILNEIPFVFANSHTGTPESGMLERFLKDPPSAFISDDRISSTWEDGKSPWDDWRNLPWYYGNLPLDVFSTRLSMLINTFLRASLDMPSLVGMNSMALDNDTNWINTTATWEEFTADTYVIKKSWFTLYMASSLVMTLCALVNIVLRAMTQTPDFLGSVSALTRDTPFVDAPAGGSFMDGTERARLLKDKWVRIQDVKPDEDVGRIAFSDAKGPGRLRTDRQYE